MAYQPLILGVTGFPKLLNQAPIQGEPGILICPKTSVLDITIAEAAVWLELGKALYGQGSGFGSIQWQGASIELPVRYSLPEQIDAVRVWRLASTGGEPQVVIRAR